MARKKQDYPADFMAFYQAYPKERHQGYVAPYKRWCLLEKHGRLAPIEVILAAVEAQKQTRQWIDGYIPMMTTWLNQQRWEAKIEDGALQREQRELARAKEDAAFCDAQRLVVDKWNTRLATRASYYKYNLAKLLPVGAGHLGDTVDTIVLHGATLYVPDSHDGMSLVCAVADAYNDFMTLRFKALNWTQEASKTTLDEFPNAVLLTLVGRYGGAFEVDLLPSVVTISVMEGIYLRNVLHRLCDPSLCTAYRAKHGYKPFFPTDTWLMAFSVDALLERFNEVV